MPRLAYGTIVIWAGSVATIPPGWRLCDGGGGTPDLRNQFVVGAGAMYNPGDVGGFAWHDHTVTTTGHFHTLPSGTHFGPGSGYRDYSTTSAPGGTAISKNHLPPYYALAYIMRI